ncbi:MAG: alginate export family protein [Gemmatimonadetes bacterium]|nr:alginate export family protein [Gemmatimonadota bacterium]
MKRAVRTMLRFSRRLLAAGPVRSGSPSRAREGGTEGGRPGRSAPPGVALLIGVAIFPVCAFSAASQTVTFGGQVRPRYEFRDPAGDGRNDFVSMRVRAHVSAALERQVRVFVQVQDVRVWGEETSTLADFRADNLDLHQGYVQVGDTGARRVVVRIGRQEATFGEERLIGLVDWTQQGRSFDGVRVTLRDSRGVLDVLGFKIGEVIGSERRNDESFFGAYAVVGDPKAMTFDLYSLYDRVRGRAATDQVTVGTRWAGAAGYMRYRAEASYQAGQRADRDLAAFMVGGLVGAALAGGRAGLTLWYDYLSGDANPADGKAKVFDTVFATNHRFYGYADVFLDIPAHTAGRGLEDLALKGTLNPGTDVAVTADLHTFRLAKRDAFASAHLGEELDLTATYRYAPGLTVLGGFSYVWRGDALVAIGRLREDMSFAYLMVSATF